MFCYYKDIVLIFITKIIRMISYGIFAVIFFSHLLSKGISLINITYIQIGIVAGQIIIFVILTTIADKIGRINILIIGSLLQVIAGYIYAEYNNILIILIPCVFGVISTTGGDIQFLKPI